MREREREQAIQTYFIVETHAKNQEKKNRFENGQKPLNAQQNLERNKGKPNKNTFTQNINIKRNE